MRQEVEIEGNPIGQIERSQLGERLHEETQKLLAFPRRVPRRGPHVRQRQDTKACKREKGLDARIGTADRNVWMCHVRQRQDTKA